MRALGARRDRALPALRPAPPVVAGLRPEHHLERTCFPSESLATVVIWSIVSLPRMFTLSSWFPALGAGAAALLW